jgi:CRP/FNR family transcriptional regulator
MRQDTNTPGAGNRLGKKPDTLLPPKAPALRAVSFLKTETDPPLLTDRQREELARIGTRLRLPARTVVYREGATADAVFAIDDGAVKTYREMPSGRRIVTSFLFDRDLFGLAQKGKYVNAAQAITRVTLYRLPLKELTVLLKHDSDMQFQFLVKITHALRESQRRAVLVSRRDAAGRLAMFIALMAEQGGPAVAVSHVVPLPMTRSDIAAFLNLSLESVSRASAELKRKGLVAFDGRHAARILDVAALAKLVSGV